MSRLWERRWSGAARAVWLKQMWLALDLRSGRALPEHPFPGALRQAARHRLTSVLAFANQGHTVTETFSGTDDGKR
eukprot:4587056-Pyramimonas_sp.AAC.1